MRLSPPCVGFFLVTAFASLASAKRALLPYQNSALTPGQRAHDLVGRMTLEEKVSQMGNVALAVPRLDVPAYNYWNEALHGVARSGYATMFPQAIGMASTWDPQLLHAVGDVIATEGRAKNNDALAHGNHGIYFGLTFWSPNINIFRDPRWGRGQETYGEDPYLTGQLGNSFIEGLQGDDPKYLKVVATPKHFAVHSGPESLRHKFNVDPTPHDLWDTYLPQFRTAIVDAKADSIMCSYNAVDGVPACGSKFLLVDTLRTDWHFKGFVTSDCGAIDDFFQPNTHQTEPDAEHADRDALLAGTDTNCGGTYSHLGEAVHRGLVQEADIDRSLERLFEARIRLGLFDPKAKVAYARIPFSAVHSPANVAVARRAAEEAMVLLKNDGTLPLQPGKYKTVAVIGPNAALLASLEGNYYGTPHDPVLPVDALRAAMPGMRILYAQGAPLVDGFSLPVPRTMLHPAQGSPEMGLHAEYFAGPSLNGRPVKSGTDPQINFDWSGVNPLPRNQSKNLPGNSAEGFAVRWTGTLGAPQPGSYTFSLNAGYCQGCITGESFKVLIDGQEVAASTPAPTTAPAGPVANDEYTGLPVEPEQRPLHFSVNFAAGQQHAIEIDFLRRSDSEGSGVTLSWTPPEGALLPGALETAKKADLIVAMLGLSADLEGEEMPVKLPGFSGGDRTEIGLPASQEKLLEQLAATGKPLVVVLLNGSALAVNFADRHANAVLEAWYPGEVGGYAIADTLLGVNNPSGRLPLTFYAASSDLPSFDDYSMRNRTYRYFAGKPLYSFGYGLSYTKFAYSGLKLSSDTLSAGNPLTVEADVRNTGSLEGSEVAELYLTPPSDGNGGLSPRIQLEGVQRLHLAPGQTRHISFTLDARQLSEVDAEGARSVQAGHYSIAVGGGQPADPRLPSPAQTADFVITGTKPLPH